MRFLFEDPIFDEALLGRRSILVHSPESWNDSATILGSASISVQIKLLQRNHPGAEKFNSGAAIHGPFDCFQSIDLALGLTIAPGLQHRVSDSVDVLMRCSREAMHGIDA